MSSTRLWYLAIKKEITTATAVKPTHFIKFKEWDILLKKEVIENNPIMNNRWNSITPVNWKIETSWNYKIDLDTIESTFFLYWLLWSISTSDIWSTAWQVYQHTLTTSNTLPSFTIEQGKWNLTDTSNNLQNYEVDRAFWVIVDKLKLSWKDWIIEMEVDVKAHWVFQKSSLINNATAWSSVALAVDTVEWLTTSDTVNISDLTPQNETDAIASISTTAKTITIGTLGNSYTTANEAKVELTPQTPSYTESSVYSFVDCNFQFWTDLTAAASASEVNIEDWEFNYENNLEERYWSLRSSPSVIAPKWAKAMLKFTKYFENVRDRDIYLNLKKQAVILTITNNVKVWAWDTNNYKYTIKLELSDLRFTTSEMPTWTDELYWVSFEWSCFYDNTDWRAVRCIVTNNTVWTNYTA